MKEVFSKIGDLVSLEGVFQSEEELRAIQIARLHVTGVEMTADELERLNANDIADLADHFEESKEIR